MNLKEHSPPIPGFPIPLDRIANDFHISLEDLKTYLESLGAPIGKICGRPAIEPHYYLLAFRKTCGQSPWDIAAHEIEDESDEPITQNKQTKIDWITEIDRMLEIVPAERVDRELFEVGPMSIAEVADYLDCSKPVVYKLVREKQLYQLPRTNPARICPRSVVLKKVGLPDPRLGGEE